MQSSFSLNKSEGFYVVEVGTFSHAETGLNENHTKDIVELSVHKDTKIGAKEKKERRQ